jgi:hypothetical protein
VVSEDGSIQVPSPVDLIGAPSVPAVRSSGHYDAFDQAAHLQIPVIEVQENLTTREAPLGVHRDRFRQRARGLLPRQPADRRDAPVPTLEHRSGVRRRIEVGEDTFGSTHPTFRRERLSYAWPGKPPKQIQQGASGDASVAAARRGGTRLANLAVPKQPR